MQIKFFNTFLANKFNILFKIIFLFDVIFVFVALLTKQIVFKCVIFFSNILEICFDINLSLSKDVILSVSLKPGVSINLKEG